jgi:hypothetical protein
MVGDVASTSSPATTTLGHPNFVLPCYPGFFARVGDANVTWPNRTITICSGCFVSTGSISAIVAAVSAWFDRGREEFAERRTKQRNTKIKGLVAPAVPPKIPVSIV